MAPRTRILISTLPHSGQLSVGEVGLMRNHQGLATPNSRPPAR
jgi:hypothetical protein